MVPGSHPMEKMQSMFQCTSKRYHITARSNLGPTFQKKKLQRWLVDHTEVDCDELFADMPGLQEILPEPGEDSDGEEDANDPGYVVMDTGVATRRIFRVRASRVWVRAKTIGPLTCLWLGLGLLVPC
jgi:hypothetical protein